MDKPLCVQVALPIPGECVFHYSVPEEFAEGACIGKRVVVPFKGRQALGFIVGESATPPPGVNLKEIEDIVDDTPLFDSRRLELFKWIAGYYFAPIGMVIKAAHPAGLGVGLRKMLRLSCAGEKALLSGEGGKEGVLVLRALTASGGLTQSRLISLTGVRNETINSLVRKGYIDVKYELYSNPRVKREKIVHATPEALAHVDNTRLGVTNAGILRYIAENQRVGYEELKDVFGNVSPHLAYLKKKGLIEIKEREVYRDPYGSLGSLKEEPPELNRDQHRAYQEISKALSKGGFDAFLLHGVTGSGKTEVYLRVVGDAISAGREAIVLVPEISLTPQLVRRFRARFGSKVAVIHSALSDGDRFDAWRMASRGDIKVVIGARSAVFAPFGNLGVIVVDEEHDPSYKQDECPSYNARDLALVRGSKEGAVVVLGSATPSLETYANTLRGKIKRLVLPVRVEGRSLPEVVTIDMRKEKSQILSKALRSALVGNFRAGKQTILFLNKRGFSSLLLKSKNGEILMCPNCTIPLTYHKIDDSVMCHFCGMKEDFSSVSKAQGEELKKIGFGTEKVEQAVTRLLPQAKVARMDSDAVRGKSGLLELYSRLEKGEVDVLIGTQMVAKGHDLPGVTLVGVISADMGLAIPDFRSGERTFQLLTQVAGRSGRGDETGTVYIQTYNPHHPSIRFAVAQDVISFLDRELEVRRELGYPPFTRMVNFKVQGTREDATGTLAHLLGERARALLSKLPPGSIVLTGPSPAPIYKIKNRFRWLMLARSEDAGLLHSFTKRLLKSMEGESKKGSLHVDVDPLNFT
jgi:primosomal protein N' (replication factor Y)